MKINWKRYFVSFCMVFSFMLMPKVANAGHLERCVQLSQEVRKAHYVYFGTDYPAHYSVGQLQQESNCKNVISNDGVGSEGPAQITFKVWKSALNKQGITEIRSTKSHLRAQAYINKCAYNEASHKKLWVMYQIYNGGGLVNKEIARAGVADWAAAKQKCNRRIIHFSNGYSENACDINYDYSKKVFKYGDLYRTVSDSKVYSFW